MTNSNESKIAPSLAQFAIAAPTSDAGKTTVSLALLRAFRKRGKAIQAFKCGPDYIDSKFHTLASGSASYNLDTQMMSHPHLLFVYAEQSAGKDVAIVEGVMGMFDGAQKSQASTAELSKTLAIPIILVVNARAVAYSVAPLLYGFKNFDPSVEIAGVIFNQVNTASHYRCLTEACADVGIVSFGYLKKIPQVEIPSRHLGLSIAQIDQYDMAIERLAEELELTVDLDAILEGTQRQPPIFLPEQFATPIEMKLPTRMTIAVARDEAFNFIYEQHITLFRSLGTVHFFSPLADETVPAACDLLYLPGGYPECYLRELSGNKSMLASVKQSIDNGTKVLAECGGFMYLGASIEAEDGTLYPMVGALTNRTSMKQRKLHLGYRLIQVGDATLKGHEFHYSSLLEGATHCVGSVTNVRGEAVATKLFKQGGVLASYNHFYFGTTEQFQLLWEWMK